MTGLDPAQLFAAIEADARALDTAGKHLGAAIRALAESEVAYHQALTGELLKLLDEHKGRGERLPAEDVRKALAHQRIGHDVYARFLLARGEVDALRGWARSVEAAMSGRQSLLSAMRAEVGA